MTQTDSFIDVRHPLGTVGLLLMLVVARLAEPALATHTAAAARAGGFAARRAIDAVGIIGWLFDRLPSPRRAAHRDRGESRHRAHAASRTTATIWM